MEIYKMIYKKGNNTKNLRILGEVFMKNNRNKISLIYKNKKINIEDISSTNEKIIKIKMILSKDIKNKSCMFKNCESLEQLSRLEIDYNIEDDVENDKKMKIIILKKNIMNKSMKMIKIFHFLIIIITMMIYYLIEWGVYLKLGILKIILKMRIMNL